MGLLEATVGGRRRKQAVRAAGWAGGLLGVFWGCLLVGKAKLTSGDPGAQIPEGPWGVESWEVPGGQALHGVNW